MLSTFGLKTKYLRIGDVVQRGDDRDAMRDAFERYCPVAPVHHQDPLQIVTALQVYEINGLDEDQSVTPLASVTFKITLPN
jgi:hypothetical protein